MKRAHTRNRIGRACLLLAVGTLFGCGITEEITQELSSLETPGTVQAPSGIRHMFDCPAGKVLASETTLGRCTLIVVNNSCVTAIQPGLCDGDPKGYKVALKNQCDAVLEVRNEGLQNGTWVARWGKKKTVKPGGSYEWGMAATHGKGVRFVCP